MLHLSLSLFLSLLSPAHASVVSELLNTSQGRFSGSKMDEWTVVIQSGQRSSFEVDSISHAVCNKGRVVPVKFVGKSALTCTSRESGYRCESKKGAFTKKDTEDLGTCYLVSKAFMKSYSVLKPKAINQCPPMILSEVAKKKNKAPIKCFASFDSHPDLTIGFVIYEKEGPNDRRAESASDLFFASKTGVVFKSFSRGDGSYTDGFTVDFGFLNNKTGELGIAVTWSAEYSTYYFFIQKGEAIEEILTYAPAMDLVQ